LVDDQGFFASCHNGIMRAPFWPDDNDLVNLSSSLTFVSQKNVPVSATEANQEW
jgi:hypothetical protein